MYFKSDAQRRAIFARMNRFSADNLSEAEMKLEVQYPGAPIEDIKAAYKEAREVEKIKKAGLNALHAAPGYLYDDESKASLASVIYPYVAEQKQKVDLEAAATRFRPVYEFKMEEQQQDVIERQRRQIAAQAKGEIERARRALFDEPSLGILKAKLAQEQSKADIAAEVAERVKHMDPESLRRFYGGRAKYTGPEVRVYRK